MQWIDSLPNGKGTGRSKLKAVADDKLYIVQIWLIVSDSRENIVLKENASY